MTFSIFIIVLAAIGYGSFWFIDYASKSTSKSGNSITHLQERLPEQGIPVPIVETPLATSAETPDPETSIEEQEEAALDKDIVEINVLNGGAASGTAGKMGKSLKDVGFKNVDVANATSFDYTGITIFYTEKSFAEELQKELSEEYIDVTVQAASSDEEKGADLVIIVGAKE